MGRQSNNEGAAAAMEYLRALRGEDEVPLDTEEVPLLSGPDAVPARVAAEADSGAASWAVGSGELGSSAGGSEVAGSAGAGSRAVGSGVAGSSAAADDSVGTVGVALAEEWVTCPECGTAALIDPAQRRAEDFCANCDFPLFWARSAVIAMEGQETGASLRRLPGTVGRAATAGVACPHCGEMNSPVATVCVRCGLPMVIVEPEPEPEPEPVYVAPEPVEPEPEPEPEFPFIWVLVICIVVLALAVGLTLYFQFG